MRVRLAVLALMLALPATANATVLCVPTTSIPGCPAGGSEQESNLQQATTNGNSGDEILIGAGTFNGPLNDGGKSFQVVGAGEGRTVVQGAGSPAMMLSGGSTVTGLTINLYNSTGNTGLELAGTATGVAVTATGTLNTENNIGVDLNGGTLSHSSVTLPLTGIDDPNYAGVIGDGTVTDSAITAAVGVDGTPTLDRDTITANQGILDHGDITLDDTLIKTVAGAATETGIGMSPLLISGTITARHVTVVGGDSAGSVGLDAQASAPVGDASTTAGLDSSIIRGYAASIRAIATPSTFMATTTVNVAYSYYDPSTKQLSPDGGGATAMLNADAHSGNIDPKFVNAAAGNFHLLASSPAIDGGDPAPLASGESTTDLDGNPRVVAGHKGHAAVSDVGAYEFQPHAPTVSAHASKPSVVAGGPDTFAATGADTSPGDSVAFRWSFDDGAAATGATVKHTFTKPGRHTATVTAIDLDGFTATATVTITATTPKPKLTHLKLKPRSVKTKTVVSYGDSQRATTTFTIERKHGHKYVRVATFKHRDKAGKNKLTLKRRHLRAGDYKLVAVAKDAGGKSHPVSAKFTIIG
jgi:hypothetical protein